MISTFFYFAIALGLIEKLLQLLWVRQYFSGGILLRNRTQSLTSVPTTDLVLNNNIFLRSFELKRVRSDEFAVRQGKFGISRNMFFHGYVRIDRENDQINVKAFIDLSALLLSMACGGWLLDNQWLGVLAGAAFAWVAARYFVDEKLLISIAGQIYHDLQNEQQAISLQKN